MFDTVLLAIGRTAITDGTNCEAIGVQLDRDSRKIICPAGMPLPGHSESTAVPNIFAIGDVLKGGLELTPVAVLAGKLLAQRLFDGWLKSRSALSGIRDFEAVRDAAAKVGQRGRHG